MVCIPREFYFKNPAPPGAAQAMCRLKSLNLQFTTHSMDDVYHMTMLHDDDVYYYIRWRLKLEGETENMGVCTKERKS